MENGKWKKRLKWWSVGNSKRERDVEKVDLRI